MKSEYVDTDLSYLAGFIEADGCIQTTGLRVTNRNLDVLNWIKNNFGGNIRSKVVPGGCWEWNLHGDAAANIALLVKKFMKFKSPQVDILIEYRKTIGPRGRKVSDEHKLIQSKLRSDMKKEKNKWKLN